MKNCKECLLLITVIKDPSIHDNNNKFIIEVTQEDSFLKENRALHGHLSRLSSAYYELYNDKEGSIVISLNTQNKKCVQLFVKKGDKQGRASGSVYDYKTD